MQQKSFAANQMLVVARQMVLKKRHLVLMLGTFTEVAVEIPFESQPKFSTQEPGKVRVVPDERRRPRNLYQDDQCDAAATKEIADGASNP